MKSPALVFSLFVTVSCGLAQGQGRRGQTPPTVAPAPAAAAAPSSAPRPAPVEQTVVTHHSAHIGGQQINYTATAGTYVLKSDDGTPKASVFYVAYTKDGVPDITRRPVSFVFNGGPGSASSFTHMGMGPRTTVLLPDGHGTPPPYDLKDNEDSYLDASDLVFIDAISTGYSRPAPGEAPSQFHGIIADATWFSDFIYQYITRNTRWSSPKYLIGERLQPGVRMSARLSSSQLLS